MSGRGRGGFSRGRGIRFTLPAGHRVGITLRRPLQWLLWCQTLSRQQRADRGQTQSHSESRVHSFTHDLARPPAEAEPVLPRILPIDPATPLPFLLRGQGPRAARRLARREPAIDPVPVKAVTDDHFARTRALARPHMTQCPSVSRHDGTEADTINACCLTYALSAHAFRVVWPRPRIN